MDPTSDLAEITLWADLKRLHDGLFDSREEMLALVEKALASVAALERVGGFSRGDAELAVIKGKLLELERHV